MGGWGWRMWSQWECFQPAAASPDQWGNENWRKKSWEEWNERPVGMFGWQEGKENHPWWRGRERSDGTYPPLTSDFSPAATLCASPAASLNKGPWLGSSSMMAEVGSSSDTKVINCSLCPVSARARGLRSKSILFSGQVFGPESISATLQAFIHLAECKRLITKK